MPSVPSDRIDENAAMQRALQLAAQAEGHVEPNPMVGCVVVRDGQIVGEGCHERFGEAHAEVNALRAAGEAARGATLVVTLEPCCHTGKTPPCSQAVIKAGIARVVVAMRDPFPKVDGGGIAALKAAGIKCQVGVGETEARQLIAPYLKRVTTGQPWVIAKWAMTLDGKIATHTGSSQWISGPESRAKVHALRGRVDAILVGAGTLAADDPRLTARPKGPRTALRIVVAGDRPLPLNRQLWQSREEGPVLVAIGEGYPSADEAHLQDLGIETLRCGIPSLLDELGNREITNLLVEGGGKLLGTMFDQDLIDEVWAFVAPKIVGGVAASPVAGVGVAEIDAAFEYATVVHETCGADLLIRGRKNRAGQFAANDAR